MAKKLANWPSPNINKVDKKLIIVYIKDRVKSNILYRTAWLCFVFLLLILINFNLAYAESKVYTEVNTEGGEVYTEITNIVNDKEVKVESDSQGEIKVEVKNGEVNIESNLEASPKVTILGVSEEETGEIEEETLSQVEEIQVKIFSFFENFFSRLQASFFFWR